MKNVVTLVLATTLMASLSWGAEKTAVNANVKGSDAKAAQAILDKKCTKCHSGKLIDAALKSNKDMVKIQQEMEKKGAKLNAKEREVLGIFWKQQNPLKQGK